MWSWQTMEASMRRVDGLVLLYCPIRRLLSFVRARDVSLAVASDDGQRALCDSFEPFFSCVSFFFFFGIVQWEQWLLEQRCDPISQAVPASSRLVSTRKARRHRWLGSGPNRTVNNTGKSGPCAWKARAPGREQNCPGRAECDGCACRGSMSDVLQGLAGRGLSGYLLTHVRTEFTAV